MDPNGLGAKGRCEHDRNHDRERVFVRIGLLQGGWPILGQHRPNDDDHQSDENDHEREAEGGAADIGGPSNRDHKRENGPRGYVIDRGAGGGGCA